MMTIRSHIFTWCAVLIGCLALVQATARADSRTRGGTSNLIVSGYSHALVLPYGASQGYAWGTDNDGEVGNGSATTAPQATPNYIFYDDYGWSALAAGDEFSVGIDQSGNLWGWGNSGAGQAGASSGTVTSITRITTSNGPWKSVAAGWSHACAINASGSLYCWGDNSQGELGYSGSSTDVPQQVGSSTWVSVSAGDDFTVGIQANGTIWGWGANSSGQLATGSSATSVSTPTEISTTSTYPKTWVSVAAGGSHVLG